MLETPNQVLWQTVKDPDEMQPNAAFHQGLHFLLRLKQPLGTEIEHNLEKIYLWPLKLHNKQSLTYCYNTYGKIYQSTKG